MTEGWPPSLERPEEIRREGVNWIESEASVKSTPGLAGMLAVLVLGGCGLLPTTRIDVEDNRVFLPSLRAAVNLTGGKEAPAQPRDGHAVEFGFSKARGSDRQSLPAGQPPVIIGSKTFSAPQQLRNNFDFSFVDVAWRWRKFFGGRSLGLEVLAGLANARLDLAVSSSSQQASQHFSSLGPQAGAGLIWRLNPATSIQARILGFVTPSDRGVNEAVRGELSIARQLNDNFAVRAGYTTWGVTGQGQTAISDFRLDFSGPALVLELNFGP